MENNSTNHTRSEKLLLEAARGFNSTLEYDEIIKLVLRLILTAVEAEVALIFRIDHNRTDMKIRYMRRGDEDPIFFHRELGLGSVGWVARYKEPVIINNPSDDPRIDLEIEKQIGVPIRSLLTVPLIGKGQMIGVIEAINCESDSFTPEDLDLLTGLSNQMAVAVDNANLYRTVKREALEKDLLYEIGMKLSGSLSLGEVLEEIMNSVAQVVKFDAGGIFMIDRGKAIVGSQSVVGYDPDKKIELDCKIGQGLVGNVAISGEPVIVPDVSKDERYVDARPATKSEIVAPILLDEKVIGVLNLESDERGAFGKHDLRVIRGFAAQAAISIERARLHDELISGQKLVQQLSVAREIQQSFLPEKDPQIDGYDVAGYNMPSGQVGGDYYDFIDIVKGQTGIAMGDVSGKGVPAALLMASFRASLIAEIRNNYSIRTICRKVNNLLCESMKPGNFVTAVYGVLDSKNHIFTFSNCGHTLPILMRADGSVEYLREGGQILGVTTNIEYEERPIFLHERDLLFFYTDGVTEAFSESGEEFGVDRLNTVLQENRDMSAGDIMKAIQTAVHDFAADDHIFDDLTMIVIKRLT